MPIQADPPLFPITLFLRAVGKRAVPADPDYMLSHHFWGFPELKKLNFVGISGVFMGLLPSYLSSLSSQWPCRRRVFESWHPRQHWDSLSSDSLLSFHDPPQLKKGQGQAGAATGATGRD